MRINVKAKSRRLETISVGDVLVFRDREEIVDEVDTLAGDLHTKRNVRNTDKKSLLNFRTFPFKQEYVVYNKIEKIYPESTGEVYDWIKMRTAA